MAERFSAPAACILLLIKDDGGKKKVLLHKRQNTGFADGLWDFSCSGHVEHGESMKKALVREAEEELGIEISLSSLNFFTFIHKRENKGDITYYNAYFYCDTYSGEPYICESEKCAALEWCDINELPSDLIDDRKQAFKAFLDGVHYVEYGWQ